MKPGFLVYLSLPFLSLASADELHEPRVWTGTNGHAFRGTFHKILPDGTKIEILTEDGKVVGVGMVNLIQADQDLVKGKAVLTGPPGAAESKFKVLPVPNRATIPRIDPRQFNGSGSDSVVDALWISLLWWSREGILEVPKKGDFARKAEWLHKDLTRRIANGDKTAEQGIKGYFEDELAKIGTSRVSHLPYRADPAKISAYTHGANAVILSMTMTYANGRDYSVASVLESMDGQGKFALHFFGRRFTGQLKVMPKEDEKAVSPGWEYVLDNRDDLPSDYATNQPRFFMGDKPWTKVMVLKPYVYLEEGKPSPLPVEAGPLP